MQFSRSALVAASLAVVSCGFFAPIAKGQQPVAVVAIAPIDGLIKDTTYLLQAANVPEFGGVASIMAMQYTQGIDQTKPIGVSVTLNGQTPSAMVFIPMTDLDLFFGALAGMGIEPDDLGGGLYEIDAGGQTIFAKQSDGWMYVSQTESELATVPANPDQLLGQLPANYDISIRLDIQALPDNLKSMAVEQMRIGLDNAVAAQGDQTEEQAAAAEAQLAQLEQLMQETDKVILGWQIDQNNQVTYMDAAAQFVEGSKLAAQAEASANTTSDFTAFVLPNSSARFIFSTEILEADRELAKQNFRNQMQQGVRMTESQNMPEEARELLAELLESLGALTEQTIDEGKFDGAGSVSVADGTLRVLVGGRIADGAALAAAVKKAAAKIPSDGNAPKFEFDYETYKDVTLHRVTVPIKVADPAAKRVFGDELKLVIGTAPKAYMVSVDPSGDSALKAAIDRMEGSLNQKTNPLEGVIELTQLLEFAQAVSPNSILDNAVQTIKNFSDKDEVSVVGTVLPRGGKYRLSIDEGVLRTIGAAAKSGGGGGF